MTPLLIAGVFGAVALGAWLASFRRQVRRLEKKGRWRDALDLTTRKEQWGYLRFFLRHRLPSASREEQDELRATVEEVLALRNMPADTFPSALRESIRDESLQTLNLLWDSLPSPNARETWARIRASAKEARDYTGKRVEKSVDSIDRLTWQIRENEVLNKISE